jgi:hypothetical protein
MYGIVRIEAPKAILRTCSVHRRGGIVIKAADAPESMITSTSARKRRMAGAASVAGDVDATEAAGFYAARRRRGRKLRAALGDHAGAVCAGRR